MEEEVTVQKNTAITEEAPSANRSVVPLEFRKPNFAYVFSKRTFDIVGASIALVLFCIPMLVISICIRATSPGKALFMQKRVGINGKLFTIYKFRSMVDGAHDLKKHLSPKLYKQYMRDRKLVNDPRITSFGSLLRKTSLDELPQLLNILRGEMSFVGPRPLLEDEVFAYGAAFALYKTMQPGLTGLWQVRSRHFTALSERAKLDETYYQHRCIRFDLLIFWKTFAVVFHKKGAC